MQNCAWRTGSQMGALPLHFLIWIAGIMDADRTLQFY
jgi:hypothetical protein